MEYLVFTRALLTAALDGSLGQQEFRRDPNFGFDVPVSVPGVDDVLLDGQQDQGPRAVAAVGHGQLAVVILDDAAADGQAQPSATPAAMAAKIHSVR